MTYWAFNLPFETRVERIALAPDLNRDGCRELRVLLTSLDTTTTRSMTLVLSGADGHILYRIWPDDSFDPWDDDPADYNGDGEVTYDDAFGILLPLSARLPFSSFSNWDHLTVVESGTLVLRFDTSGRLLLDLGSNVRSPVAALGIGASAQLRRVVFAESHEVLKDYDTANPPVPPIAPIPPPYPPEWLDSNLDGDAEDWSTGDIRAPIAYTAGSPIKIDQVAVEVDPPGSIALAGAQMVGRVNGNVLFVSNTLVYNSTDTIISATAFAGSSPSQAGMIDYRPDWQISWAIEYVTPNAPIPAGISSNHVYFVLLDPPQGFELYYTLLDVGVRRADGLTNIPVDHESQIAAAIYREFLGARGLYRRTDVLENVLPVNTLAYYADWTTLNTNVKSLLAFGDGQCHAWAELFWLTMHAVGIDPLNEKIMISAQHPNLIWGGAAFFVVKEWTFGPGAHNPLPSNQYYPHIGFVESPFIANNEYHWIFTELSEQHGVPGQGTSNPASFFNDHYLVQVAGKYYDPSYGTVYTSIDQFESNAIAGYGIAWFVNPPLIDENDLGPFDVDGNGQLNGIRKDCVVGAVNPAGLQVDVNVHNVVR